MLPGIKTTGQSKLDGTESGGAVVPSGMAMLTNFMVQWVTENIADFTSIAWLTVMEKQPVLSTAHKLYKGWTFIMAIYCCLGTGFYLSSTVIPSTYAHMGPGMQWSLLTKNMSLQLQTDEQLCGLFPNNRSDFC